MPLFLLIILGVIVFVVIYIIVAFNNLIALRTRAQEAWADIDVQFKRRYDLIPNLIETVKGYAAHEREIFEKVSQARAMLMQAGTVAEKAAADNALSSTLKSLFAVAEAYPDLKASQNFLELQKELADTENKIEYARRFYNGNVRDLNIKIQIFPANIIANNFGFKQMEMFEVKEAAVKEAPKVKF